MTDRIIQTADGISLWISDTGRGEPVLLIAGANASGLMWPDEFVARIRTSGYRVILYDHRDTGKSDRIDFTTHPYFVADLCDDAIAVLDGLGVEKAHVVGLSLGGTIGQVLALDHAERLLSLSVMMAAALDIDFAGNWMRAIEGAGPVVDLPGPKPEVVSRFKSPLAERNPEIERRVEQWRILSSPAVSFDAAEFAAREEAEIDHAGRIPAPFAHALGAPIPLERGQELKSCSVPTLVIQAMDDPLNPPPHGRHIASLFANARLVEIADLGHALPNSRLNAVLQALLQHWRTNRARH